MNLSQKSALGHNNHCNCYSYDNPRIQISQRHWLVWISILSHYMRFPASMGSVLYLLQLEMGIHRLHHYFWNWKHCIWLRAKLNCPDNWPINCWYWVCRHFCGEFYNHRIQRPAPTSPAVYGAHREYVRHCFCVRAAYGRRLDRSCQLEVMFLYKYSSGNTCRRWNILFLSPNECECSSPGLTHSSQTRKFRWNWNFRFRYLDGVSNNGPSVGWHCLSLGVS